jgi:hypothetical protein
MIDKIPLDIVLFTRDYLYPDPKSIASLREVDSEESFLSQEAKWSWRNFLSMSKKKHWKEIRRQVMIFALNKYESHKYFTKPDFRNYVNSLVLNPGNQVELKIGKHKNFTYSWSNEVLELNPIGCLNIEFLADQKCFPRLPYLHTLIISGDIEISHLQDLPSLITLQLTARTIVTELVIVDLPRLLTLRIDGDLSMNSFALFPLEQLTDYCSIRFDPAPLIPRWKSLATLEIYSFASEEKCIHLPKLPIPSLQSLIAYHFESIDVSGLSQLRKLKINCIEQVRGLSDIYASLERFCISTPHVTDPILDDLLTHSTNDKLKVDFATYTNDETEQPPFLIHQRINSLQLTNFIIPSVIITTTGDDQNKLPRYFEFVRLHFCPLLTDLSIFQHVQHLLLNHCKGVTDVFPVRNVPYLHFTQCDNIQNLSCLGSSHRLELQWMDCLKNEDLIHFGNVSSLLLQNCDQVTEIGKQLQNTRFLSIFDCKSMQEIQLEGKEFVKVTISGCSLLNRFQVLGKVYCLEIINCGKININSINDYVENEDSLTLKPWEENWLEPHDY